VPKEGSSEELTEERKGALNILPITGRDLMESVGGGSHRKGNQKRAAGYQGQYGFTGEEE